MLSKNVRVVSIALMLLICWAAVSSAEEEEFVEPTDQWIPLQEVAAIEPAELPEPEPLIDADPESVGSASVFLEPIGEPIAIDSVVTDSEVVEEDEEENDILGRPYNGSGWYSMPKWDSMTWRTGSGNRFGEFALEGIDASPIEDWDGLSFTNGSGFHFLDGPNVTDMPPRLFDFNWGLHYFDEVTDRWWLDLSVSGGLYTDFEDSVQQGWRFPAHAVATWALSEEVQPVLGIRYLDRDNLGLLPVAGVILRPEESFRMELVFPEPRVAWRVSSKAEKDHWLSISGRIGGGEWAIERRATGLADVVTYNEYQVVLALDTIDQSQSISSIEAGYIFERDLEYRSGAGNTTLPETFFIRLINRK